MNIFYLFIFAFSGIVSGSQEISSALKAFESKLSSSRSGDLVYELVDKNDHLPDILNEMATIPGHAIPITDPYLLYRFHRAVNKKDIWKRYFLDDAHYKIAFLKGKIAEIDKTINDLVNPPEDKKGFVQMLRSIFTGNAEVKRQLDSKNAEKKSTEDELHKKEAKLTQLQEEVEKIEKFVAHFNVDHEIERLSKVESVRVKLAEEKAEKRAEEKGKRERKAKKKTKRINWGGIKNF